MEPKKASAVLTTHIAMSVDVKVFGCRPMRWCGIHPEDDVIDNDLILVWGEEKRIITGADLLGRLLRGIVTQDVYRAIDSRRVEHVVPDLPGS